MRLIGKRHGRQRVRKGGNGPEYCIPHRLRGNIAFHAVQLALSIALVSAEKKDTVLLDRATARPAELIVGERRLAVQKRIAGIQVLGLEVLKQAAMKHIRSRAGEYVHLTAQSPSILRREDSLDDVYFLNRLQAENVHIVHAAEILSVPPLRITACLGAIDGKCRAVFADSVESNSGGGSAGRGGHAGANSQDA